MNKRITYTPPRLSPDLPLALESRILAGSVVNQSSLEAAPQPVESYDFSSSGTFSHNWEGGDSL